jgi:hypothetical protein
MATAVLAMSGVGTSVAARVGQFMHRSRGGLDHSHLSGLVMQDSVLAQLPSFDTEGPFQEPMRRRESSGIPYMSINQWENSLADFLCFRDRQDIRTELLSICKRSEVEKLEVHHLVKRYFFRRCVLLNLGPWQVLANKNDSSCLHQG